MKVGQKGSRASRNCEENFFTLVRFPFSHAFLPSWYVYSKRDVLVVVGVSRRRRPVDPWCYNPTINAFLFISAISRFPPGGQSNFFYSFSSIITFSHVSQSHYRIWQTPDTALRLPQPPLCYPATSLSARPPWRRPRGPTGRSPRRARSCG